MVGWRTSVPVLFQVNADESRSINDWSEFIFYLHLKTMKENFQEITRRGENEESFNLTSFAYLIQPKDLAM